MSKKKIKILCIIIPVCLCSILIIANLIQYFQFYKVLNEVYETCKKASDSKGALAFMEYANNLETDSLLTTGITVISIAVTMWIGLNIYNAVNRQDVEKKLDDYEKSIEKMQSDHKKNIEKTMHNYYKNTETVLQNHSENLKATLDDFEKRIDDSDEKREKKTQYLTRKAEFANLLYLTGERYCASNFFATLFWKTKTEYSNIDSVIKCERKYVQCCISYEKNELVKANILARELVEQYRELMSEDPYMSWDEADPMKNFLKMRLSDTLFYKNMTTHNFDMREAQESIRYYNEIIKHLNKIIEWDREIKAYFYNSQGYTLYHMSRHALDSKREKYLNRAQKKLEDAVINIPYKGRYRRNLGLIYQAKGQYKEARKTYKEAFIKDPSDYKAYNTVAALDLKEFDKETGIDNRNKILLDKMVFKDEIKQRWQSIIDDDIKWCKSAERICFSFVDTHYNMAKAYLYKYICEERTNPVLLDLAKVQISIAENLNPDAPGTMFIKRNICEADGNFEEAYKCVDEKLIKENDRNDKLRGRYKEEMKKS